VLCDYSTLYSLPEEEFATGMAEVIKHGVLADRELFAFIAEKDAKAYLGDIIPTNLVIKRRHVMEDEFDVGLRQLLNLGHTLAHAVEKLSNYEINHGNAVSIGLAAICRAAYAYGLAEEDITDSVVAVLKKYHLMTECPYTAAECVGVLLNDKKRSGQTINLAIPKKIGECYLYKMDVDRLEEFYRLAIG
jgi:3-dehydroquinate synthase